MSLGNCAIVLQSLPAFTRLGFLCVLIGATWLPRPASAEPICRTCEVHIGVGGTYHFWGSTNGVVLPLTVSWHDNRYEVGVFRMSTPQTLTRDDMPSRKLLAEPYWGVSASRRWMLWDRGPVRAFFGFGLAYRTQSDALTATRWDFASQLGLHVRLPRAGSAVELTMRHWSNGGVKLPNRGQDFATLTFVLEPQWFRSERYARARDLRFKDQNSLQPTP
jgi:hypothetical protein